jgi:hypothetical protein
MTIAIHNLSIYAIFIYIYMHIYTYLCVLYAHINIYTICTHINMCVHLLTYTLRNYIKCKGIALEIFLQSLETRQCLSLSIWSLFMFVEFWYILQKKLETEKTGIDNHFLRIFSFLKIIKKFTLKKCFI